VAQWSAERRVRVSLLPASDLWASQGASPSRTVEWKKKGLGISGHPWNSGEIRSIQKKFASVWGVKSLRNEEYEI